MAPLPRILILWYQRVAAAGVYEHLFELTVIEAENVAIAHPGLVAAEVGPAHIELGRDTLRFYIDDMLKITVPNILEAGGDGFIEFFNTGIPTRIGGERRLHGEHGVSCETVEDDAQVFMVDIAEIAVFNHIDYLLSG